MGWTVSMYPPPRNMGNAHVHSKTPMAIPRISAFDRSERRPAGSGRDDTRDSSASARWSLLPCHGGLDHDPGEKIRGPHRRAKVRSMFR
jgi:hypothetical protein